MNQVIESSSKQAAINACAQFLSHFPFRYAAIVDMHGNWGWVNGKTKARMNSLVKNGYGVYMVEK